LLTFFFRHMQELIKRGNIFVAQPPLYRIKKGKSEKYIKDDKEFTREILRRATENVKVELGDKAVLEGTELRNFLMSLDDFQLTWSRLERRLRDPRVVRALSRTDIAIDTKADFQEEKNLRALYEALKADKVDAQIPTREEEHSSWRVTFKDPTNAERPIDIELASAPEYKRLRAGARAAAKFNRPPFVVIKDAHRDELPGWRELLAHVKSEGTREVNVQRYKGLGEMNAEQLWSTTMNIETRTLLKVSLEDLVQADLIFTTLMGEDVESRRKFIEENALDVKNLDV
jgi:DNA gyrase subunit B